MARPRPYVLIYADAVKQHLRAVERKYHSLIQSETEARLTFEPDVETRNRKPLRRSMLFGAEWELRLGPDNRFRVFYQVNSQNHEVDILAIGVKVGNRLFVGNKEIEG
jgi:hypothetical protein